MNTSITKHTKPTMVIKDFFGYRAPEHFRTVDGKPLSGLQDFAWEMKNLSGAEKTELARLAAKELGYSTEEVAAIEAAP